MIKNIMDFINTRHRLIILSLIVVAGGIMLYTAAHESAIFDESAHIPAGYGYVKHLDYRLNPEHPPLLKALSALPLALGDFTFPIESRAWTEDINGQWRMGEQFFYESGNNPDTITTVARIGPIFLSLALILFIAFWSFKLLGPAWGLIPPFLLGLSPHFLAHGHYVTTDIAAAFGVVTATYFFLKFLEVPSRASLLSAGIVFGIAQICKFSLALIVPYFAMLLVIYLLATISRDWNSTNPSERFIRFGIRSWHHLRSLIVIFIIGYVFVVYPTYTLFTANYPLEKQVNDTREILGTFANGPVAQGEMCKGMRCLAELNIAMAGNSFTRPLAEYMLGVLMIIQRASGGNTTYFMGEVSAQGWHYYFPLVYFIKEPLPLIILLLVATIAGLWYIAKKIKSKNENSNAPIAKYTLTHFTEIALLIFVVFYWAYSIKSNLNIGFRHLFPSIPFIYMLIAIVWKRIVEHNSSQLKQIALASMLIWYGAETVFAFPHFLSYFNQIAGGTSGGYRFVTDSNYDWGQDLLYLKEFVEKHPEINKIAVDYFGGGRPKHSLGDKAEHWWSARGNPKDQGIEWLAVSLNSLQGSIHPSAPDLNRKPNDEYRWLTETRDTPPGWGNPPTPDYRAGTSIFIYKL